MAERNTGRGGDKNFDKNRGKRSYSRDGRTDRRDNPGDRGERRSSGYSRDDRSGSRNSRDRRDDRRNDRDRRDDRDRGRGDDRRDRRDDRGRGRGDRDSRDSRNDRGDRRDSRPRRDGRDDRRSSGGGFARKPQRDANKPHTREYKSADPNEPIIPAGVMAEELDKEALEALSTLSGANREIVARHLVMAGQTLEIEPELAYQHAQAAVKRAGRVDVVREAAALTAYATGRYEEALREVRAVRRMRGDESLRAIEADSERGLGRPEKALTVADSADYSKMSMSDQVELVLVSAGARADLKQYDAALMILDDALHKLPDTADLYYAGRLHSFQADVLRQLGREDEAAAAEALIPEPEDEVEIVDIAEMLDADVDHTRTSLRGSHGALSEDYDSLVLDLDGVCFQGTNPIPYATESLRAAYDAGMNLAYATNNASRTPEQIVEKLKGFDIPAEADHIMTSSMDLMYLLQRDLEAGSKVLVVGSDALEEEVEKAGFLPVRSAEEDVVAVTQGYGASVGWAELSEAAYAINGGARFYATNLDSTLPTERGMALGNGSLVAAVSRATGRRPEATGKPNPEIMQRTAALVKADKPLAVGDRLGTDTAAAVAARMPTMHVLTGVSSARDVVRAKRGERPTFVALDMRGLFEEHPQPKHHRDGTWTAGMSQPIKFTRWGNPMFDDIMIRDDGDAVTLSLDNYRALAAAAWEQVDSERPIRIPELIVVDNEDPNGQVIETNFVEEVEESAPALAEEATVETEEDAGAVADAEGTPKVPAGAEEE